MKTPKSQKPTPIINWNTHQLRYDTKRQVPGSYGTNRLPAVIREHIVLYASVDIMMFTERVIQSVGRTASMRHCQLL